MTRIATHPGSDAYIVCVGLPPNTVAQVVHALGGQHAVLVVPDRDSAVRLLAPDLAFDDGSAAEPEPLQPAPPDGGRVLAFPQRGPHRGQVPVRSARETFTGPTPTAPSGGVAPGDGAPGGGVAPAGGAASSDGVAWADGMAWAGGAGPTGHVPLGQVPTGHVPVVTGAIPAVTGGFPTVTGGFPVVPPTRSDPIARGPLTLDLAAREVRVQEREVHLSAQEFDLLATLASQPGRVWTFAELTAHVWGTRYLGDADAVTSAIKRLRRRLPRMRGLEVASVRGVGYRLRIPE